MGEQTTAGTDEARHERDETHDPLHLPVLPHSGKVEQLRREMADHPPTTPAPATTHPAASAAFRTATDHAHTPTRDPNAPPEHRIIEGKVIEAVRQVYEPEIPVNIYELGLIYDLEITPEAAVKVRMTLTTPMCPAAGSLPGEVERKVRSVPPVSAVKVDLVWDPPWDKSRMSEAAQLELGLF